MQWFVAMPPSTVRVHRLRRSCCVFKRASSPSRAASGPPYLRLLRASLKVGLLLYMKFLYICVARSYLAMDEIHFISGLWNVSISLQNVWKRRTTNMYNYKLDSPINTEQSPFTLCRPPNSGHPAQTHTEGPLLSPVVETSIRPLHTSTHYTPPQRHSLGSQAHLPCLLPSHQGRLHSRGCVQGTLGQETER